MTTFEIYPLGKDYPITVRGNKSKYFRDLNEGNYRVHVFEVVDIPNYTMRLLLRNATDRGASRFGWYAHSNGKFMDYNYRKTRRTGIRYIDINTYRRTL